MATVNRLTVYPASRTRHAEGGILLGDVEPSRVPSNGIDDAMGAATTKVPVSSKPDYINLMRRIEVQ